MTIDQNQSAETEQKQNASQSLYIQRIYVKDLSLEVPEAPNIFCQECEPEVNLNLQVQHAPLGNDFYDVILLVTVSTKKENQTIFLIELQQAGIFHISGFKDPEIKYLLNVHCPSVLFPYARELVSNMSTRASFPPLHLAPINFEALYHQRQKEKKQSVKTSSESSENSGENSGESQSSLES